MRLDKMTVKAQEAVETAGQMAQRSDHAEVLPLHLLAALLDESEGVVKPIFEKIGADVSRVREELSAQLERLPRATGTQMGLSRALQDVFAQAQKEADRLKDEYVSTEHLLLALTQSNDTKK